MVYRVVLYELSCFGCCQRQSRVVCEGETAWIKRRARICRLMETGSGRFIHAFVLIGLLLSSFSDRAPEGNHLVMAQMSKTANFGIARTEVQTMLPSSVVPVSARQGLLRLAEPGFLGLLGFLIEALVFQFAGLFFGSFHPLPGLLDVFIRGAALSLFQF